MSENINPRLVLSYLNELGFTNINAQQLKEFMIDLKKLIKYDSRHLDTFSFAEDQPYPEDRSNLWNYSKTNQKNHTINTVKDNARSLKSSFKTKKDKAINASSTTVQSTSSCDKQSTVRKDKVISVHIHKRPTESAFHEHCIHIQENSEQSNVPYLGKLQVSSDSKEVTTESSAKSTKPDSVFTSQTRGSTGPENSKSKTAFIRQTTAKPAFNKCDPVALYHFYQSQWKRTKIPGEQSRDDLRWAIREKMLGGPKVEIKPILRKRSSSYSVGSTWR